MAQKTALYESYRDIYAETMETICPEREATSLEYSKPTRVGGASSGKRVWDIGSSFLWKYGTKEGLKEVYWTRPYFSCA